MPFQVYMIGAGLEPTPFLLNGNPVRFDTGRDAANWIHTSGQAIVPAPFSKLQPRPCQATAEDESTWHLREASRFADGTYARTVWHNESWFHDNPMTQFHFAHLSQKRPGRVSFTISAEKGRADIQESGMNPGRYLETYYSEVLDASLRHYWAKQFTAAHSGAEFHILRDTDSIVYAYRHGPDSCMSKSLNHYSTSVHPVSVYGESDFGLAIVLFEGYSFDPNPESATYQVAARCLVVPEKKLYGRVYGDDGARQELLYQNLQALNYINAYDGDTYRHSFAGCKIRRIEDYGTRLVCPYIDGSADKVQEYDHEFLQLSRCNGVTADSTDGYIDLCEDHCARCGDGMDSDNSTRIEDRDDYWCESCTENYAFYCEGFEEYYSERSGMVRLRDGTTWSQSYFDDNGFTCAECDSEYANDNEGGRNEDESVICERCAERMHYWASDGLYHNDEEPTEEDEEDSEDTSEESDSSLRYVYRPDRRPYLCDSPDQLRLPAIDALPVRTFRTPNGVPCTEAEQSACIGRGPCTCHVGTCEAVLRHRLETALGATAGPVLRLCVPDGVSTLAAILSVPGAVHRVLSSYGPQHVEQGLTVLEAWPAIFAATGRVDCIESRSELSDLVLQTCTALYDADSSLVDTLRAIARPVESDGAPGEVGAPEDGPAPLHGPPSGPESGLDDMAAILRPILDVVPEQRPFDGPPAFDTCTCNNGICRIRTDCRFRYMAALPSGINLQAAE